MGRDALQEASLYFSSPDNCREYWVAHRWPNGVACPHCGNTKASYMEKYNLWQCGRNHALRQFTAKTGTIFEDSPLGLDKWLMALWLVVNCQNGLSSYELHGLIGVAGSTAWGMDHRIRLALGMSSEENLPSHISKRTELSSAAKTRSIKIDERERRIRGGMKLQPAPQIPGNTSGERLSNALSMVLTVSKVQLLRQEAKERRARSRKKRAKKST